MKRLIFSLLTSLTTLCALGQHQVKKGISQPAEQALAFLYQSMPLPDSVDYDRHFWMQNIQTTLRARQTMPWGCRVPEREFRHFVLPVRVGNENLDLSRPFLFEALQARLKGLTMEQAVLEVNHWCHEHVTYTPSDERTSAPLATIRTAHGRCGEESTLLVAALRSVCIPARQVYTPRWAHTDDNHAWVEAWVDGKWRFLGACEPEPTLDLAWFNEPASRGMLMHTKAFGNYDGPEHVIARTPCYTEIALTATYAPVRERKVMVVDNMGKPVADAVVEFKIYNYAEFFTFATKRTNQQGLTDIQAGMGDLFVWAHQGEDYGFSLCRMSDDNTLTIQLNHAAGEQFTFDLDIVPPRSRNTMPLVSEAERQQNTMRLAKEDSIRHAYELTFSPEHVQQWLALLTQHGTLDPHRLSPLLTASRGNHQTIFSFLNSHPTEKAVRLLETLSQKDLRDVTSEVLTDHLLYSPAACPSAMPDSIYYNFVCCPRVINEQLSPFRAPLLAALPVSLRNRLEQGGPSVVADWIGKNIQTDATRNPQSLRMQPLGVWRNRLTDARSREIFFVALCRTLGYAARIETTTGKLQYLQPDGKTWVDVTFAPPATPTAATSQLTLSWQPLSWNADPKYYTHFSLSRIADGSPRLLNYPEDGRWSSTFKMSQTLDAGDYLLTTGTRMADGSVLTHSHVFSLKEGEQHDIPLLMRQPEEGLQVIGNLNSESLYLPLDANALGSSACREQSLQPDRLCSLLSTAGRGFYVLAFIQPSNEPTNHTLRDLAAAKEELDAWGGHLILLFRSANEAERFTNISDFKHLPTHTHFGIDTQGNIYAELSSELHLTGISPLFVIADSFNRIVYRSEGYTIGLGERLARYLKAD